MLKHLLHLGASNDRIDRVLKNAGYKLHVPTYEEVKQGIDRWLTDGEVWISVKYRIDRSFENSSTYLPTIQANGQPDWILGAQVQLLAYWIVPERRLLLLEFYRLRQHMPHWVARFPVVKSRDSPYPVIGVWVPTYRLAEVAIQELEI